MRKILFWLILIFAVVLRFYALGVNPPSLDWDEAALGYNAYSVLKTGRDEYGNLFPLSIRSFNDYKPPLYTYLTVLPVAVLGLNEFSVRFISALFGSLTVAVVYLLSREFFGKNLKSSLAATFLMAVSPWHLQFSRVAFEANLALSFVISGIFLLIKGQKSGRLPYFIFAAVSFALSIYAYHSPRLIVPLFVLGFLAIYARTIRKNLIKTGIFFLVLLICILPVVYSFKDSASARFSSVSVINPDQKLQQSIADIEYDQKMGYPGGKIFHNRRLVYFREILAGYLDHFNYDFLFLTGDSPGRHHAVGMGMLYLWEFPFILAGAVFILKYLTGSLRWQLFAWWFLIAPAASALTSGTPHAVRALFYLPLYQILASVGILRSLLGKFKLIVPFLAAGGLVYYLNQYYLITPVEYAQWWQYGYKEAVAAATAYEDKADKIIFTYKYDQPYIFYLFYNQIDPAAYQLQSANREIKRADRKIGKYEFRYIDWSQDRYLTKTLFVAAADELPADAGRTVEEIYFPDGSIAFRLVFRQ